MADEAKVDLSRERSGKNGVILKEDIMSLMGLNLLQLREKLNMVQRKELR